MAGSRADLDDFPYNEIPDNLKVQIQFDYIEQANTAVIDENLSPLEMLNQYVDHNSKKFKNITLLKKLGKKYLDKYA